jgi:hypothetical protein
VLGLVSSITVCSKSNFLSIEEIIISFLRVLIITVRATVGCSGSSLLVITFARYARSAPLGAPRHLRDGESLAQQLYDIFPFCFGPLRPLTPFFYVIHSLKTTLNGTRGPA